MKRSRIVAACALLATTAGCMQYMVQPPQPSLAGTPQTVQANAYLGGQVQRPPFVSAERCRNGEQLARVLVKRNFWQGLVSWISLGMITPATIEYSCANAGDPPLGGGGS
jgi:Bor protein